ncbi:membrane progestin receptor beta-like [Genypterus blacodes]|uniref:membrane progestin receptor beta-like n=1 Tax=Genypterus blacodes TaxID=154954 RepID=UPI003F761737
MPQVSLAPPSLYFSFLSALASHLPSLPSTVQDLDVPILFRKKFILSGYRPVGLSWRCYVLSLFQMHNQTINVWSHLLAVVFITARFTGQGVSLDVASLPLVLYVLSAITHLSCSAAAHLLQSRSERTQYSLSFLDYVGVSIYQYGCALALYLYSSAPVWTQSFLRACLFLPGSALLAWLSCASCCYAKFRFHRQSLLHRKLFKVVPVCVAYLVLLSLVTHRLAMSNWSGSAALPLHGLQVALFLLASIFFCFPIPECFSPGHYDLVGHAHQLFHLLQALCMLAQQEALFRDFLWRRAALLREIGEERLLRACMSFPCLMLCCTLTAFIMRGQIQARLEK